MSKTMDINATTGEQIVRDMTDDEQMAYEANLNSYRQRLAKEELEAAAKIAAQAKLAALGLTVEDLQALGL
jgi:hypothetical protein